MDDQMKTPAANVAPLLHPSIPHTKRFLERWTADPLFRKRIEEDPQAAVREFQIQVDVDKIRSTFDPDATGPQFETEENQAYRGFVARKLESVRLGRQQGTPSDSGFAAWRKRQMRRSNWDLGADRSGGIVHAPVCFELSSGCTVKCWFCGVGALPFGGNLPYTEETRVLWRGVLTAMRELCGIAAANGFCYWATDPLDNPDYEKFLADFHELLGRWPQTTTAIPLRDVARTRALLQLVAQHNGYLSRFSVLSSSLFDRIMAEFSAEELLHVELIPQFNDDYSPKAVAGSGRERALRISARKDLPAPASTEDGGTIACVSGFLFNMVERRVRLISPCSANSRFPLGYIVFHEFRFADADDLRRQLAQTVEHYMPTEVTADLAIRLNSCFTVEICEPGFALVSKDVRLTYDKIEHGADLARRLVAGKKTAGELADVRFGELGIEPAQTLAALNLLFKQGILVEDLPVSADPATPLLAIRAPERSPA
jgi:radical SAM family RiPP maturation amino acid epimerase